MGNHPVNLALRFLLEILALIKKQLPQIQLLLAGEGSERSPIEILAQNLNLGQNIRLVGAVPYESMSRIYHQGHLYLQTSRHESQGMSVLEAMACSLPVLGTPVGVTAELAHHPATNDATELAAQAVKLLSDPAQYEAARQKARQAVVDNYSLEQTVQRFLTLYQDLIHQQ